MICIKQGQYISIHKLSFTSNTGREWNIQLQEQENSSQEKALKYFGQKLDISETLQK